MVDSVNESAVLNPAEMVLGVAACAGEFPRLVMEGARRAGVKRIVAVGLRGAVRASEIRPLADEYAEFRVGAIEGPVAFAKKHGVTHLILAGQIKPSGIYTMWPDATARRLLAQLDRRNAHTIFGTVCDFMAQNGITVLPSTTFMEHCMAGEGLLAGPEPTPEQADAARFGMQMAQQTTAAAAADPAAVAQFQAAMDAPPVTDIPQPSAPGKARALPSASEEGIFISERTCSGVMAGAGGAGGWGLGSGDGLGAGSEFGAQESIIEAANRTRILFIFPFPMQPRPEGLCPWGRCWSPFR